MSPEQFQQVLALFKEISLRPYTITGAADWPLLVALMAIITGLIGVMWADLRKSMAAGESRYQRVVDAHSTEIDEKCAANAVLMRDIETHHTKITDALWQAMRDCQADCCPRGKKQ